MIDRDDLKRQIQDATDLISLIGEQLTLRPKGKEFVGLCPFHDDHNPSMFVSPQKQIYKCFTCGSGGDVFSFVMNYHKLSFPEAIRFLGERAGIEVNTKQRDASEGPSPRARLANANQLACQFFIEQRQHDQHGQCARQYLANRQINEKMIDQFQIGYGPDAWDSFSQYLASGNLPLNDFIEAGLISPKKSGDGHFDRLRHRLIFPICDAIGRPIAFGGRILPDRTIDDQNDAKYLNSPETPLFNKSATLYGLHLAKQTIIQTGQAVIVEGYTDVVACHQAEVKNVVATLGTSLTREHAHALRHFAQKVILIFDPDEAGQKAADRAVEVFLGGSLDIAIAILPDGCDPAELLAKPDGTEQWNKAISQARDALDYQFDRMHQAFDANDTVSGRQRVTEDYLRQLAQMGLDRLPALRRGLILDRVAKLVHLSEEVVDQMISRLAQSNRAATRQNGPADSDEYASQNLGDEDQANSSKQKALVIAQRHLLGCLIHQPQLFHGELAGGHAFEESIIPGDLCTDAGNQLYQVIYDLLAAGQTPTLTGVLGELASADRQDLANLLTEAEAEVDRLAGEDIEKTKVLFLAAAKALLGQRAEQDYQQARSMALTPQPVVSSQQDQLLKQLMEHHRANPSPIRIARKRNHPETGNSASAMQPMTNENVNP